MMRLWALAWALATALGITAGAQAPDRTRPPAPGQPPTLALPTIHKRALSNGVPVFFVESHEVPVAQLNLVIRAGSADDPRGRFGIASLTAAKIGRASCRE